MSEQWLSIVEYARQFDMSDMTVRRRIKTGRIQAVLRDGKYYIPLSEALRKRSHQHMDKNVDRPRIPTPAPVKSHPIADRFHASHHHNEIPTEIVKPRTPTNDGYSSILPNHLTERSASQPSFDHASLISFCEGALKKANQAEQRLESMYKETIAKLEAEIKTRDLTIKALAQQVEDLQVLTKILERK